jgi:dTDP-4-amino-4,6-dideoxygalactose transaminase
MIPYGRQDISQTDIDAVVEVLRSDFLTQGPVVPRFEQAVANYCGAKYAVAVNSATSALHVACLALDLGPGDWLWTSPNTFVASANSALYCGAQIDFVDIDPCTYNMSLQRLEEKLIEAERIGTLPKIVIPVHFAGQPCDMPAIHALSLKYGFKIIEDASHAIGASYKTSVSASPLLSAIARPEGSWQSTKAKQSTDRVIVGSCTHSHVTVFSFHPVKIITTGEGGMATTSDETVANRMRRLRTHGITSDKALMHPCPPDEIWNYQQIEMGFNYRMTDIQAALGLSQFMRLDDFVQRRHSIAKRYDEELKTLPLVTPWQSPAAYSSYHLYPILIREGQCKKSQQQVYDALHAAGILVNLHYIPVYRQPFYVAMGFRAGYCPDAEQFHKEEISIPIYPTMTDENWYHVVSALKKIFEL